MALANATVSARVGEPTADGRSVPVTVTATAPALLPEAKALLRLAYNHVSNWHRPSTPAARAPACLGPAELRARAVG